MSDYKVETVGELHGRGFECLQVVHVSEVEAREDDIARLQSEVERLNRAVESLRTAGNRVISYGQPLNEWTMAVQDAFYPDQARRLRQQADKLEQNQ